VSLCYPVEAALSDVYCSIREIYQANSLFIKQHGLYYLVPFDYPKPWGELIKTYPQSGYDYLLVGRVPLPKSAQRFISVNYIPNDHFRLENVEIPAEIEMTSDRVAKWLPAAPEKEWQMKIFAVTEGRIQEYANGLAWEAYPQDVCLQWVTRWHRPFLCLQRGSEYHIKTGFFFSVRRTDTFAQLGHRLRNYFGRSWDVQVGFTWGDRVEFPTNDIIKDYFARREGWKAGSMYCVRMAPIIQ
jgi:hypothetical protein